MRKTKITNSEEIQEYIKDIRKIKIISHERQEEIFTQLQDKNITKVDKKKLHDELVVGNLRFVISVAAAYQNQGMMLGDLINEVGGRSNLVIEDLIQKVSEDALKSYAAREEILGAEVMRELERKVLLTVLDRKWRDHLYEMDYLQEGIGLRAMAQRDPLVEYQREGYDLFAAMMDGIKEEIAGFIFNVEVKVEDLGVTGGGLEAHAPAQEQLRYSSADENGVRATGDVSRNAPCPCGSGKKYKRCHGAA